MAVFQFNNLLLPYEIHFAPFAHDLVLLQGSRFNSDYWRPLLQEWTDTAGGRVLTCDWQPGGMDVGEQAKYFHRLIQTLGLCRLSVVACDDAVALVEELERDFPGVVSRSLLFARNAPRGDELKRAVNEFCGLG